MQHALNMHYERMRAAEHALRGPFNLLERRHGLAEIVERGAGVHTVTAAAGLWLEELYASSAQVKRPRCEHESRTADVTKRVLYAPSINYDAPTFDEQRYQNETEPEHASRTQLVVSKSPVVT